MLEKALQPLWEGLVRHQWTDARLQLLEQELAKSNLLDGLERVVRFERNNAIQTLERYRLRHQKLPDSLEVLQPGFIERLPKDLITGQPVSYQRREGGGFTFYSVGINEQDDGGMPAWRQDPAKGPDFDRGDWVWSQP